MRLRAKVRRSWYFIPELGVPWKKAGALERKKRRGQAFRTTCPEDSHTLADFRAGISQPEWHLCASRYPRWIFFYVLVESCLQSPYTFEIHQILWREVPQVK